MANIEGKVFEHRPISELMAIVKSDLKKFDQEGLIDEGNLIKTVMYCNDKLGLLIREIRETAIPVEEYQGELPKDFEKLYYISALNCSNTSIDISGLRNPFNNNVDQTVIDSACLNREQLGCVDNYQVIVQRTTGLPTTYNYHEWTQLGVVNSNQYCHPGCPNKKKLGKYQVQIKDDLVHTPFKKGTLYMVYIGLMKDENGEITFPFHPMITPYYEWTIKEKIISDAIFNSDGTNLGELYKLAQQEKSKAWLDAFNFTSDKAFGAMVTYQKKKEMVWYDQWFKLFR